MCVIEEQDSNKTVQQSADTSKLSTTTSSTFTVWFQFCVIFTIKCQLGFVYGWYFIVTLPIDSNVTFHKNIIMWSSVKDIKHVAGGCMQNSDKRTKGRGISLCRQQRSINCRLQKLAILYWQTVFSAWWWCKCSLSTLRRWKLGGPVIMNHRVYIPCIYTLGTSCWCQYLWIL